MVNINEMSKDKSTLLFEIVHPIEQFEVTPVDIPTPSVNEDDIKTEEDIKDEKKTELEKLELEIRKSTSTKYEINEYYVRCK